MTEQKITSRKNPLLRQVRELLNSRKAREEAGLFAADGTKLLAEAVRYCPGLHTVILAEGVEAELPEHVRLIRVPRDVMASLSPMQTPQGALFLCALPERKPYTPAPGSLLLDGIQDPGNLGTILRTADALDIPARACLQTETLCRAREIRPGRRYIPVKDPKASLPPQEAKTACAQTGIPIAVTALSQRAKDLRQAPLSRMTVVIGSEGQGVRQEILDSADAELVIPMNPHCESLNAAIASAIVMWQMKK